MKLTVLGCGRWGSFLATYHSARHDVVLWGREDSESFQVLQNTGANDYLTLPPAVKLEGDLAKALAHADMIIISISAQNLRTFAEELNTYPIAGKTFILCMKGIEATSGKRLTQVMEESIDQPVKLAVWVGPGHPQDLLKGIPNCQVVDSKDPALIRFIVENLSGDTIRLYIGQDLIGSEVGAAAKNVIGIAAGMLDGFGYGSLKGALMARGAREVSRLMKAMGGSELSAYGLCHLGDYEATLFSPYSHNRMLGESIALQKPYDQLAEGADTVRALRLLGKQYGVELPISNVVYEILYEKKEPLRALDQLFQRSTKGEFDA